MSDSAERNCDKCIHHINGYCDSWDCNMQTVEDVKKEAVNEYVKAVVEELSNADPQEMMSEEQRKKKYCDNCGQKLNWESDEE